MARAPSSKGAAREGASARRVPSLGPASAGHSPCAPARNPSHLYVNVKVKPPARGYFPMTDIPSFDTIKLDVADHVATITLNRPERLNSMQPAMAGEIRAALDWMGVPGARALRSEANTSELQSLMRSPSSVYSSTR